MEFFSVTSRSKSDLLVIGRLGGLKEFATSPNFPQILNYFLINKKKSLVPFIQRLLNAKDLDLSTNFRTIAAAVDTSWIIGINASETKERLTSTMARLLDLTKFPNAEKKWQELQNFLRTVKSFDEKSISQLQKLFADVMIAYFNQMFDRKFKATLVATLGEIGDIDTETIIQDQLFTEAFKMSRNPTYNKTQFRDILIHYIN